MESGIIIIAAVRDVQSGERESLTYLEGPLSYRAGEFRRECVYWSVYTITSQPTNPLSTMKKGIV